MQKTVQEMREAILSLAKQADEDRQEMREGFAEMREAMEALITNSEDIRNITRQLATAVIKINKKVKKVEDTKDNTNR